MFCEYSTALYLWIFFSNAFLEYSTELWLWIFYSIVFCEYSTALFVNILQNYVLWLLYNIVCVNILNILFVKILQHFLWMFYRIVFCDYSTTLCLLTFYSIVTVNILHWTLSLWVLHIIMFVNAPQHSVLWIFYIKHYLCVFYIVFVNILYWKCVFE